MHGWNSQVSGLADALVEYARARVQLDPVPLDGPRTPLELQSMAGETVTAAGIGGVEALRIFADVLAPACISTDHQRNLSFIPCAPTEVAILFDLVVGASSIYGGSWLEGAGAVFAENQALRWIAGLAGFPETAGGVFVQGGTIANLSALVAARAAARAHVAEIVRRWAFIVSPEAHSSLKSAASVMDVDIVVAELSGRDRRLTGDSVRRGVASAVADGQTPFAVVGTAGTTNLGIVDELASVAAAANELDLWFHVDGAYGAAALCAPSARSLFAGIEQANSLSIDPHKWLFAPFDCAALIYRDPELGRSAHTQHASYLDVLQSDDAWNPSDYSIQLTRRARGLPLWFSLATYGTDAYANAVERTLEVARYAADAIGRHPTLELLREPDLSVLCFRRNGWSAAQYDEWSERLRIEEFAFVTPTKVDGETVARFAIVNPVTNESDIDAILETIAH